MKNKINVAALMLVTSLVLCSSCRETDESRYTRKLLSGKHYLHKLSERTDVSAKASSFFIFGSTASASSYSSVKFAWLLPDSSFVISSLPLEKIRVRLSKDDSIPFITFFYHRLGYSDTPDTTNIQRIIDEYIDYAVITIQEKDWPTSVQMPLDAKQ